MGVAASAAVFLIMIQILSSSAETPKGPSQETPSPARTEVCSGVNCGRGHCRTSANSTFGFECECDPGWTRLQFLDHLTFLPCVIPYCVFDYSCYNDTISRPPASIRQAANLSIFNPCIWPFCGSGKCVKISTGHRCECSEGFSNLLNSTSLPCFKQCVVTADCPTLGFTLTNGSSSPSTPKFSERSNGAFSAKRKSLWQYYYYILIICVIVVQATISILINSVLGRMI